MAKQRAGKRFRKQTLCCGQCDNHSLMLAEYQKLNARRSDPSSNSKLGKAAVRLYKQAHAAAPALRYGGRFVNGNSRAHVFPCGIFYTLFGETSAQCLRREISVRGFLFSIDLQDHIDHRALGARAASVFKAVYGKQKKVRYTRKLNLYRGERRIKSDTTRARMYPRGILQQAYVQLLAERLTSRSPEDHLDGTQVKP